MKTKNLAKAGILYLTTILAIIISSNIITAQSSGQIVLIKNRYRANTYIKSDQNSVSSGALNTDKLNGAWVLEAVGNGSFRIRKNGTSNQYINVEKGPLECSIVPPNYATSHWKKVPISGTPFVRIQNYFRNNQFLNVEKGPLESSDVPPNYWTSHWVIEPLTFIAEGDWAIENPTSYFEITKTSNGLNVKGKQLSGDDLPVSFNFIKDPNNSNRYGMNGDMNNTYTFINDNTFEYRVNGQTTIYTRYMVNKATPPYQIKLTLDKLVVDYDGDWGIHDPGELFWEISLNGNIITSRGENETKEVWEGDTYQFQKDLLKIGESDSIVLPKYSEDYVIYDLTINFFEKDDNEITSFGETHDIFPFIDISGNPGQHHIKIDNGEGNVTLYYTVEVQKLTSQNSYKSPSYPKFETFTGVKPDEELNFVLILSKKEQEKLLDGCYFDMANKLKQTSSKLEEINKNLTDLESQEDLSAAFASISAEVAIDGFAAGPEVGGVLLAIAAVVNGIAQPFIFAGVDYNLAVFVANYTDNPLKIKDFKKAQGTYIYGPKDGIIPAKVGDNVPVGVFIFKKNYGYDGIMGAFEFGAYDNMPNIKVGYGIPYRDNAAINRENQCLVEVGGTLSLNDFYTRLDKDTYKGKFGNTSTANNIQVTGKIGGDVTSTMTVIIKSVD